jgi:hypothetical protein
MINASGEISGEAINSINRQIPAFWSASTGWVTLAEAHNPYGSYGLGINDAGMMTGQMYVGSYVNAFYWRPGGAVRFAPPLSSGVHMAAYDINNHNYISGEGILPPDGRWEAFIWSRETGTVGIGFVPGSYISLAHAINDNNEVAGISYGFGFGAPTARSIGKREQVSCRCKLSAVSLAQGWISIWRERLSAGPATSPNKLMPVFGVTIPAFRRISALFPAELSATPAPLITQDRLLAFQTCPKQTIEHYC